MLSVALAAAGAWDARAAFAEAGGQGYPALLSASFDAGEGLLARLDAHRDAPPASADLAGLGAGTVLTTWALSHRGQARTAGDERGPGQVRDSGGATVGAWYAPASGWRLGAALDRTHVDVDVRDAAATGELALTQLAVQGGYDGRGRFVLGTLAYGRGAAHATGSGGDDSAARFGVSLWSAGVQAGVRSGGRRLQLAQLVGADWQRVRSGDFAEQGGLPWRADAQSTRRTSAWLGLAARSEWDFGEGRSAALTAALRYRAIVGGRQRQFALRDVADPDEAFVVSGMPEAPRRLEAQVGAIVRLSARSLLQIGVEGWRGGRDRGMRAVVGFRIER
jgi:hypothetical protein